MCIRDSVFSSSCRELQENSIWQEFKNSLYGKDWCPYIKAVSYTHLCRELTKKHETAFATTLGEALAYYEANEPKGECVLVIEGKSREELRQDVYKRQDRRYAEEEKTNIGRQSVCACRVFFDSFISADS